MKRFAFICLSMALILQTGCEPAITEAELSRLKTEDKEFNFVAEVSLGSEYFSMGAVISRWAASPRLSVYNASDEEAALVTEIVEELNEILKPARFSIRQVEPHAEDASLRVIFSERERFEEFAQKHGFKYVEGNRGYFTYWTGPGHDIHRAVVLVDKGLWKRQKMHFLREEITQSLGLAQDSPYSRSSIFYQKGSDGGNATKFSDLDRKLIYFFYAHLKPGQNIENVAQAYKEHWERISI